MRTLADEVKLVMFNSKVIRVPYDRPFVEYQMYKAQPRVTDIHAEMPMMELEVYRAKVYRFYEYHLLLGKREWKLALDQEAQNIVDMFVDDKTRELSETLEKYRRLLKLEESKTCHDKFIDWLEVKIQKHKWLRNLGGILK